MAMAIGSIYKPASGQRKKSNAVAEFHHGLCSLIESTWPIFCFAELS
jgi:hypothetical protein